MGVVAYKPIDWFDWLPKDLYRAGDDGSVSRWVKGDPNWLKRHPPHWRPIKPTGKRKDMTKLTYQKRCGSFTTASLILRAFVGPRPIGCRAFHYPDSDCRNNRLANLRWAPTGAYHVFLDHVMPEGNRGKVAGWKKGSLHFRATISEEEVPLIFQHYREGWTIYDIADELEIGFSVVWNVLTGRCWSHVECDRTWPERVPDNKGSRHGNSWLGEDDVRRIVQMASEGKRRVEIAREFDVTASTIREILVGKSWTHVTTGLTLSEPVKGAELKFSESDIERIFDMAAGGKKRSEIAKEMDVRGKTIGHILAGKSYRGVSQKLGVTYIPLAANNAKLKEEDIPCIIYMARSGKPQVEIAKEFGVSASLVSKIIKGHRHPRLELTQEGQP
jgi:transposase